MPLSINAKNKTPFNRNIKFQKVPDRFNLVLFLYSLDFVDEKQNYEEILNENLPAAFVLKLWLHLGAFGIFLSFLVRVLAALLQLT